MNKPVLFLVALVLCFQSGNASTNISGQIRSNTTWTKAGSPYICDGLIEVATGYTLNIDPGVTIVLNGKLRVHGFLNLDATATDSIIFESASSTSATVEFVEPALLTAPVDTYRIQYCRFKNTSFVFYKNGISLSISNSVFTGDIVGVYWSGKHHASFVLDSSYLNCALIIGGNVGSSPIERVAITNSIFENCYGMPLSMALVAYNNTIINHNRFINNTGACLYIDANKQVEVTNNDFVGNLSAAIDAIRGGTEYLILGNVFRGNNKAIRISLIPDLPMIVKHNSIYDNQAGVEAATWSLHGTHVWKLTLENNCIYNNVQYGLSWNDSNDFVVPYNWWGTTDTNAIDSGIVDFKDDFKKGNIVYKPYLTQQDSGCRTLVLPPPASVPPIVTMAPAAVFPNPFTGSLNIRAANGSIISEAILYDLVGKKQIHITGVNSQSALMDTRALPEGVYIYKLIYADNTSHTGKVLKR
jgi:hypothetical protein